MEPRPQRPRSTTGGVQQPASQPGGSPSTQPNQQHQDRGDVSGAFIAPPRTEYDYSPLDLAPPAQRRKRQLVGGVIGALVVLAISALAVFGYLLLRDDKSSDNGLAPTQTAMALQATTTAQVAMNQGASGTPSTAESTATVPSTQPAGAPTTAATTAPTSASASAGPSESELKGMLPDAASLPVAGLDVVEDSGLSESAVAEALGGSRTAEQNLKTWGWSGNATRSFSAADPTALDPGATSNVVVSVHGFNSPESAQAALTFFSDVLVNSNGYEEIEAPALGDKARLLRIPNEDGTMNVALYVTKGNVLYRIGGSATVGGDPTDVVLQVADAIFGANAGQ
jgi:hypothetical protein